MLVSPDDRLLFDDVVKHIGEHLAIDIGHLTPQSRLASDLDGLSSLKFFELMLYLQDSIGFDFDEAIIQRVETMAELVSYIREHRTP
jgi:acyl carrier protein